MDWKLEVVVVPVSDVDRAKQFYSEQVGFVVDTDVRMGESFRVVQLSSAGSAALTLPSPRVLGEGFPFESDWRERACARSGGLLCESCRLCVRQLSRDG
jgi:catechol 2,3-dioxygenase-like lactoylglutathione lyase family enzyme